MSLSISPTQIKTSHEDIRALSERDLTAEKLINRLAEVVDKAEQVYSKIKELLYNRAISSGLRIIPTVFHKMYVCDCVVARIDYISLRCYLFPVFLNWLYLPIAPKM